MAQSARGGWSLIFMATFMLGNMTVMRASIPASNTSMNAQGASSSPSGSISTEPSDDSPIHLDPDSDQASDGQSFQPVLQPSKATPLIGNMTVMRASIPASNTSMNAQGASSSPSGSIYTEPSDDTSDDSPIHLDPDSDQASDGQSFQPVLQPSKATPLIDAVGGEDRLLFERGKGAHIINNGLLKVYRKVMEHVLVTYRKDTTDFKKHLEAAKILTLYQHAITDKEIRENIERFQTAKKSDRDDPNSELFSVLFKPLVAASVNYAEALVYYQIEHKLTVADLAKAYIRRDKKSQKLGFVRSKVIRAAKKLINCKDARFDKDAYKTYLEEKPKEKKKLDADLEAANTEVIAMLKDIVNQLPKMAYYAEKCKTIKNKNNK